MPVDPYVLAGLKRAFDPRQPADWGLNRRYEDIELPMEPPPPPAIPFGLPSPPRALSTEPDLSQLPEVAQPLAPGEVYSQKAYTGDLMKGTAQFPAGRVLGNEAALAGLKAAQGEQNIPGLGLSRPPIDGSPTAMDPNDPFSLMAIPAGLGPSELSRLASRAPGTSAPGSNEYFTKMLQEEQGRQASFLTPQRKIQEEIEGAIGGLHPAVQEQAERAAQRGALGAIETGRAQAAAARMYSEGRLGAAETSLEGRLRQADMAHLNALALAIANIQRIPNPRPAHIAKIRELQDAYDSLVIKIRSEGGQVVTVPGGADEDDYEDEDEESLF